MSASPSFRNSVIPQFFAQRVRVIHAIRVRFSEIIHNIHHISTTTNSNIASLPKHLATQPSSQLRCTIVKYSSSHIIGAVCLSRPDLIKLLDFARTILNLYEINGHNINPSETTNQLKKGLSKQREQCELVQSLSSRDESLHGKLNIYP